MAQSGIDTAIRELESEMDRIRQAVGVLRGMLSNSGPAVGRGKGARRGRRNMSAEGRRRISLAAKKRWAAHRAAKAKN